MSQRVAVVTGGTGWLGRALLPRLAARGDRLATTYLIPEEAEELERELALPPERLLIRRVDATDGEAVTNFLKEVQDTYGAVHILCCLVGGWAGGRDVEDTDDLRFERMLDLNLRSAFHAMRAAIPHQRAAGWGRIVTVASRAVVETPGGQAAFNLAKAGLVALTMSASQELAGSGVTANVVLPAVIDTPDTREAMPYADYVDWPTPDEIAAVIEFLTSDAGGVITGASIPVYGEA